MTEPASASQRQKAVDRYFRAADVGTLALIVVVAAELYDTVLGPEVFGVALSIGILSIMVAFLWAMYHLFRHRHSDEFTLALWHTGVTAAFIVLIFWALFGNVIAGLIWGLTGDVTAEQSAEMQFVDFWTAPACIGAFFAAFQFKRFKGV